MYIEASRDAVRGRLGAMLQELRVIVVGALLLGPIACGGGDEEETAPVSEDWASFGNGAANTRAAVGETKISPSNVSQLQLLWSDVGTLGSGHGLTATPAVVDDVVYTADWEGNYKAFTSSGNPVWAQKHQSAAAAYPDQVSSSLVVTGDTIYSVAGQGPGVVRALERSTGDMRWETPVGTGDSWMLSSPVLADDMLVFGIASAGVFLPSGTEPTFRGMILGVDRHSGAVAWTFDATTFEGQQYGIGISVWSSAVIDTKRKHAYIGTGQSWRSPASPLSDSLIAINYVTGELVWHCQFTPNDAWALTNPGGPDYDVGSTPNLFTAGGKDMVGVGDKSGSYYALDRDCSQGGGECTPAWQKKLGRGTSLGGVMGAGAYHDGVIYVSNNTWDVSRDMKDPANKSHVLAFQAGAGDFSDLWEAVVDGTTFGGLAWANGVVFVPTTDGELHALDASSGSELWKYQLDDMVGGGVSVSRGKVYVGQGFLNIVNFGGSLDATPGLFAFGLP